MYAVVEIQGSQFKVSKDQKLYVNRIDAKEGSKVSFDNVLLVDDGNKVQIGKPNLSGTAVEAKIISHLRDDKVIVFKKKRRKGYKVKNGHRQSITEIVIQRITDQKPSSKRDSSSDKTTIAKKSTATKKTTAAKKTTAVKKTTAAKKTAAAKNN